MKTILLVEDDEVVHDVISCFITSCGYNVLGAYNMEQARQIMKQAPELTAVLLDGSVPASSKTTSLVSTVELVNELLQTWPECRIIAISGDQCRQKELLDAGCHAGVMKPAKIRDIREALA